MAPVPMSKVFFANSGSEANDTAIKLIWYYNNALGRPEKKKIISRKRGYHGVTVAAASLTGLPANHRDFDLPIAAHPAHRLPAPLPHRRRRARARRSSPAALRRRARAADPRRGAGHRRRLLAEPVMGAGGVIVPPASYFAKIQAVLKQATTCCSSPTR